MKKKLSTLFIFLILLTFFFPAIKVFALQEGQTELEEIVITGDIKTETLEAGELPIFEVNTSTPHVSIEAYGDNTGWAYLENGTWHGFGGETSTAVEDGPFYAMRLKVDLSDGYVFTENTKLYYNGRNMLDDTYSSITPFEWGGYAYIDLGQVFGAPGPSVEDNVIKRVEVYVDMPQVGDKITITNNGETTSQTQFGIGVREEDENFYGPDGDETHNYMYILDNEDKLFDGTLEENGDYHMVIMLVSFDDYIFDDNVEIFVNGEHVNDYYKEDANKLNIDYLFKPNPKDATYTITTGENNEYIAVFEFPEGTTFELAVTDILKYTPEEIEAMFNVPAEYIEEVVKTIKNNVKEHGELISLYSIEINGPGFNYSDKPLTFKIRMTDEMKKYNSFKFIYLDENNNFVIQEVHNTKTEKIDGVDYIVVDLDHLSAYALVGYNTEDGNPTTADKIVFYVAMLVLSITGLAGAAIYTKKKYFEN